MVCYLSLGSNLRSPERQLRLAMSKLRRLPSTAVLAIAPLYHNPALGRRGQPNYCNTVVALKTRLTPFKLLTICQRIEWQQGRVRKVRWGARTLDIDILFFGSRTIQSPRLTVPHPRINKRDFVLVPLSTLKNYEKNTLDVYFSSHYT